MSGQNDTLWVPRRITHPYAVLYSPPGADLAWGGDNPTAEPGLFSLLTALNNTGYLVIVGDYDNHAFGHDGLLAEWETFRSTLLGPLAATLPGGSMIDTSKVIVGGHSQGATDATRYAQTNPAKVAACFCLPGVFDLIGFYTGAYRWGSDAGTANQSQIATAWGVTYPTPLPSRADPYNNASLMSAIPTWVGYSLGDTTCTPAQCQAFATAAGSNATAVQISATTLHSDAEAADAVNGGVVSWLLKNAA